MVTLVYEDGWPIVAWIDKNRKTYMYVLSLIFTASGSFAGPGAKFITLSVEEAILILIALTVNVLTALTTAVGF